MARHSHWHNIQLVKGKADARRAQAFAKLAKSITLAAKEGGGDTAFNFKLRVAVEAARAANMPKDNIERAIARGSGQGDGAVLEEVIYEGFALGGVAILVVCVTENRNRTVAEVKNVVSKKGGTMGAAGSVMWMFVKKGVVRVTGLLTDRDVFDLAVIEAGAEDILSRPEGIEVLCALADTQKVAAVVLAQGVTPSSVGIEFVAKNTVVVEDPFVQQSISDLVEALENLDDVDAVYTNEE